MYQPKLGQFMSRDPMPENGVTVLSPVPDMRKHYREKEQREHEYVYARNNPTTYVDPSGEAAQVVVLCVCGLALYEVIAGIVCASLYDKAVKKDLIGTDPGAHKKHCYVSCCLNKANLWIPIASPAIGVGWEICTGGIFNPRDALKDLEGDFYGIYGSYLDNCAKHCDKLEV